MGKQLTGVLCHEGVTCKLGALSFYSNSAMVNSLVLRNPTRTPSAQPLRTMLKTDSPNYD